LNATFAIFRGGFRGVIPDKSHRLQVRYATRAADEEGGPDEAK
jgi:hypothetical protein